MIQEQLRDLRKTSGLTQAEMSRRTGLSQQYISRIEAGKPVTLETMEKYAQALGQEITVGTRFYDALPGMVVRNEPTHVRKLTNVYHKFIELSQKEFVILSHEAALEALGLFPGYGIGCEVDYYAKEDAGVPGTVFHKMDDVRDIGYVECDGMRCTDTNWTFNDVFEAYDRIDDGAILYSMQSYYLHHDSSFDTLRVEPQNRALFESLIEDAIYY